MQSWAFLARGPQDPDEALVAGAKRGQKSAFDALRSRHDPALRGFVARRVGLQAADDLLQEVWLACWSALPRYAGRSRFKAWLYGIAAHKCVDTMRDRAQAARREAVEQAQEPRAADAYQAVDLRESVRDALSRLPGAQREVIELYYYAELTLAEIAQTLGRNLNTVKYQFYRAHAQVAQELKHEGLALP